MFQHDNTAEQVGLKFLAKLPGGLLTQIKRHIEKLHAFRLVQLFQAVDDGSALHCDPSVILYNPAVRLQHLRCHVEGQFHHIAARPAPLDRKVLPGGRTGNLFSVYGRSSAT